MYNGPLGQQNSLKLEIDFIQNVVLPVKKMEYKNVWKVDTRVSVMDIREICAEKIRASGERVRYRDFYDLFQIIKNYNPGLKEIVKLIKQKEVRKPFSQESILTNWKIAKEEKNADLQEIYYSEEVADLEIKKMIKALDIGNIEPSQPAFKK